MNNLREMINNDTLFYILIIIGIFFAINIISKFLENVLKIAINFDIIFYYFRIGFIKLIKFLFKLVFFPLTIYRLFKEFRFYNSLIINNSRLRQ